MTLDSVAIVGPGRMGLALGAALMDEGAVRELTYYGRRPEPPAHPLFTQGLARYVFGAEPLSGHTRTLILAVPDEVVPEMAFMMAAQGPAPDGCTAYHLSGALPTDVLEPLHERGYAVASFHPLQVIANPIIGVDRIAGSSVAVTGGPQAVANARRLTDALGCRLFTVPAGRRPLYHAAVVLASSYLLPLLDLSSRLMVQAGVSNDDAVQALLPLVRGVLASVEEGGVPSALGGPIARGDVETVALHLRALEDEDRTLYATLGAELLRLGTEPVDAQTRADLAGLFERYLGSEPTVTGS